MGSAQQMPAFQVCELFIKHVERGACVRAEIQKHGNSVPCFLNENTGPEPTFRKYQFPAAVIGQVINPCEQGTCGRRGFKVGKFQG